MQLITCPWCGGTIQHAEELAGQHASCPHCKRTFAMPPLIATVPTALPGPPPSKFAAPNRSNRGCTLLVIGLVVCTFGCFFGIVILGGMASLGYVKIQQEANKKAARIQAELLADAVKTYVIDVGDLPQSLDSLIVRPPDLPDPSKWTGPYIDKPYLPLDPWNQPFEYEIIDHASGEFRIWSNGPDIQSGSPDDISTPLR